MPGRFRDILGQAGNAAQPAEAQNQIQPMQAAHDFQAPAYPGEWVQRNAIPAGVYGQDRIQEYHPPPPPQAWPEPIQYIETSSKGRYVGPSEKKEFLMLASKILAGTANKTIEDVIQVAKQVEAYVYNTKDGE